ncbi:uncharacterized protein LOC133329396 [Musca vetustissima]|uniref:uncharacterized protein LOC133329396 n=1 Tax=Musca vetustissima TaxID=27455 RepID=UPI002AB6BE78|nr:uncharacterized protein LOC133329396 [Musca vetustissima]
MRAFIVLCLVAGAFAQYNYHAGSGSVGGVVGAASNDAPFFDVLKVPDNGAGVSSGPSFDVSAPQYNGNQGSFSSTSNVAPVQDAGIEKEFYTFSANDDDFAEPATSNQYANSLKKGIRVIFIKGPEHNGLEDAALALAKHAAEQKTAIYVLNKQADLSNLANKLNTLNNNVNHKPEVHFVKYRTSEDAANAQKAIQDQYNSLGGSSQHFNGGVAPALNFASQAPVALDAPAVAASSPAATSATYLPASIFRRFRL